MSLKRKELVCRWEAPDALIEKRLRKKVFTSLSRTGDISQVWSDYLSEHLQFPFYVYVKEPSLTPGTVRCTRMLVKELANPPYSLGGNVVVIGSLSSSPDHYAYYFLHDFASVEADEGTFQAIQAYHYWHYFSQRATFLP
jgi:Calcium binding